MLQKSSKSASFHLVSKLQERTSPGFGSAGLFIGLSLSPSVCSATTPTLWSRAFSDCCFCYENCQEAPVIGIFEKCKYIYIYVTSIFSVSYTAYEFLTITALIRKSKGRKPEWIFKETLAELCWETKSWWWWYLYKILFFNQRKTYMYMFAQPYNAWF